MLNDGVDRTLRQIVTISFCSSDVILPWCPSALRIPQMSNTAANDLFA